jgi:hypothetical protein
MVINIFLSSDDQVNALLSALSQDPGGFKCVYLAQTGCLWGLKPIVCEMFLCQYAKETVLGKGDVLRSEWEKLRRREKLYTWPSRPVLFDKLEEFFIQAGYDSPLMYMHHSPGLLKVKAQKSKAPNSFSNRNKDRCTGEEKTV